MRRASGALLLLLLLGLAAGCRGATRGPGVASAGGAHPAASASAAVDDEERRRQFTQCLRDHGMEVDDADPNGGGNLRIQASAGARDAGKGKDAMRACQQYLPAGKLANADPQQMEQLRQFAACMREHGIDMPDPDPNNGGALQLPKGNGPEKFNPDNPAFQAAEQACKDKLPGRKGGAK
ncbi:MAG TPA: hypothetical protein VGP31_08580 [Planosporangium sp.]|jgi:hypothetical protein|nr:hypothetical protein [Planosporangium sp.]